MSKQLVLAEKPSVGRDIARVLNCTKQGNGYLEGKDYIVTWALGHLVTLADPEAYDVKYKSWNLEDLPMLPKQFKLVVIPKTSKQFKAVKEQMLRKDVDEIISKLEEHGLVFNEDGELELGNIEETIETEDSIDEIETSSLSGEQITAEDKTQEELEIMSEEELQQIINRM